MGEYVFKLPDIGEGIAEAEISAWHVAVGDEVAEDDPLVDMLTDKANVELTSPVAGRVTSLAGTVGDLIATGSTLVVLASGADVPTVDADGGPAPQPALADPALAASTATIEAPPAPVVTTPVVDGRPAGRTDVDRRAVLAAPAVRQRAADLGIDLALVHTANPTGRIRNADLDAYVAYRPGGSNRTSGSAEAIPEAAIERLPVVGLRRRIAERMSESKRRIPHFSYVEEVDVTDLEVLRAEVNAAGGAVAIKLTVLPFLIRALVGVLPEFPQMNARYDDEAGIVERHSAVHVGIAAQTANGLVVPVVRHAESFDLHSLGAEIARLAAAARDGRATSAELGGSTITISSLGPLGGVSTTPVINHPEVAIIGVNKMADRAVVRDGQIAVRRMMNLSCSFDHRVIDGHGAAEFVQSLRRALERPAGTFVR